jgi:hypothetical protein
MKETPQKPNQEVEVADRKVIVKKPDPKASFGKFMANRERNKNNSSVGPSWGGRKGN